MNSTILPPLKAVTATDHGGILAITASLGLVFGLISVLIRMYVRIECRASFGNDDYASFLSLTFAIIQSVIVFLAISQGFGEITTDLTPAAIAAWQKDMYISDIFYLVGMWLTKSSVALLLMRLSRDPSHGIMARMLLVAAAVYFVVSIFVVAVRCDITQPWVIDGIQGCATSTYARWAAVTAMDAITELSLFVGGFWLVRDLQLSWSKKSVVVIAYGLRLPVIVAAAMRLYYLRQALLAGEPHDLSFQGVLTAVCTQIELGYAVVATTMPCLKPFMSALNTSYGGVATFVLNQTPNSSALQRSRDGDGNTKATATATATATTATFGMSSAARAAAKAVAKVAEAGQRASTESSSRILELEGEGKKSYGGESQKKSRHGKTTTITASKCSFDRTRMSGAQSPTGVAVTVDITVTEEKDPSPSSPLPPTSSPSSPTIPHFHRGHERIGEAE